MRTFRSCLPALREYLLDSLQPDVFIHTWSDTGLSPDRSCFTFGKHSDLRVTAVDLEQAYRPRKVVVEEFPEGGSRTLFGISVPPLLSEKEPTHYRGALPMFYKMYACNQLKIEEEKILGQPYDVVVRMRPDILLGEPMPFGRLTSAAGVWFSDLMVDTEFQVSDKLAFGQSSMMDAYCSVWEHLAGYWRNPLGEGDWKSHRVGERLMKHHLQSIELKAIPFSINCHLIRQDMGILAKFLQGMKRSE